MGAQQSNLSSPRYGYDLVVASTQASINATLQEYLSLGTFKETTVCFVMNSNGSTNPISLADLVKQTGVNPFEISSTDTPKDNTKVEALSKVGFLYGFKAKIGLPQGYAPITPSGTPLPPVVVLNSDNSVSFNLMCEEFQVVQATYGPVGLMSWLNTSQPLGNAWLFNARIPLTTLTMEANEYATLPTAVNTAVKALPANTFSVQQLLFLLDKAILTTSPTIEGVQADSNLAIGLKKYFLTDYFNEMATQGKPVLNYTIKHNEANASSVAITEIEFEISQYTSPTKHGQAKLTPQEAKLSTLNYLCSTAGKPLPPPVPFTWNWVDASEEKTTAGVMAVNKNEFIEHLKQAIKATGLGKSICKIPMPNIHIAADHPWEGNSLDINFRAMNPGEFPPATYTYIDVPNIGGAILNLGWSASGSDSSHDHIPWKITLGTLDVQYYVNSTISLLTDRIRLTNHFTLHADLEVAKVGHAHGNWVDVVITTDYILGVDPNGNMTVANPVTTVGPNNQDIGANWVIKAFEAVFSGATFDHIIQKFESWTGIIANANIGSLSEALNGSKKWVFPGGKSLKFQSVGFSRDLDLVANFLYETPNS